MDSTINSCFSITWQFFEISPPLLIKNVIIAPPKHTPPAKHPLSTTTPYFVYKPFKLGFFLGLGGKFPWSFSIGFFFIYADETPTGRWRALFKYIMTFTLSW
jgi:hypothetical protein